MIATVSEFLDRSELTTPTFLKEVGKYSDGVRVETDISPTKIVFSCRKVRAREEVVFPIKDGDEVWEALDEVLEVALEEDEE